MPCYYPVDVKVRRKSRYGRGVLDEVTVPCGSCLGCRAEQARQWAVRIMHEAQMHEFSWFLTLTYADEELPKHGSLHPPHLSRFIRSLRRKETGAVRYYGCGEYGETTERPHYHAVLFGPAFLDRYRPPGSRGTEVWRSETLESHWPHGHSSFGTVTMGSASYVAGYVRKKVRQTCFPQHYQRYDPRTGEVVDLVPEFARMSLKPAIGRTWIERYWRDVYPRDFVVVDGRECKPPRYYDKWLEANHPEVMCQVRERRYDEARDLSKRELRAKERGHERRVEYFESRRAI